MSFPSGITSASGGAGLFTALRGEMDALQRQFGTGARAETYGGLGQDRVASLDIRGRLAALQGHDAAIDGAALRLKVMDQTLTRLTAMREETAQTLLPGTMLEGADGRALVRQGAQARLAEAIDLLNGEVAGRRLFAGRATDADPVESYGLIMEGDPATGRSGLKTLISERRQADLGSDGLGRLGLSRSPATVVSLQEKAAAGGGRLPFGFQVTAASSTGGAISTSSGGTPASASFALSAPPADGDRVQVTLTLPDATQATITLTARVAPTAGEAAFRIGATAEATAEQLELALGTAVRGVAGAALGAASARAAAAGFFAGSATHPPPRVAGPDFAEATGFDAARRTVIWYRGDDTADSARATAPVRADAGLSVATGAQANEPAIRDLLASLGVLAADPFGAEGGKPYAALTERVAGDLALDPASPSIEGVAAELGLAGSSLAATKERHAAKAAMLEDALSGLERADPQETAAAILSLQTRLQASYQVTAMLSRLNLVNYL